MSDIDTTDVDMFTIGNNLRELREHKREHRCRLMCWELVIPIMQRSKKV